MLSNCLLAENSTRCDIVSIQNRLYHDNSRYFLTLLYFLIFFSKLIVDYQLLTRCCVHHTRLLCLNFYRAIQRRARNYDKSSVCPSVRP